MIEYIYIRSDGSPSKLSSVETLVGILTNKLLQGHHYSVDLNNRQIRSLQPRQEILKYLNARVRKAHVGDHFKIRDEGGGLRFQFHAAEPAVKVINTNGNDKVDAVWSYEVANFPNVNFLGAYVCKYIAGSSTHSQHSYGNAVDASLSTMALMQELANKLVREAVSLSIETVIVADKIWVRGQGWGHYSGDYHYHVHTDCAPPINSSLPCGVRG